MKKILIAILTIGALISISINAQTNTDENGLSVTANTSFVTQYMFRGVRLGGPSFQPSVEASIGNFTAGVWMNEPLRDKVVGTSDPEIDVYGSYSFDVKSFSIQPGFTAYVYPNADTSNGSYEFTFEPNLAVSYTLVGITITPKAYYDVNMDGPTFELNTAYTVPLKKLHTELDFTGVVGTYWWDKSIKNSTPSVKNSGSYYQIGVTTPFDLGKHFVLTPGVSYVSGFDNYIQTGSNRQQNGAAVGRVVGSISLSYNF